ncbi:MAG TPA: serine hydrolase domain-containing protein [Candidatus Acidoferrales bacterium]|nr:serine hydrolase domain-containing protein [Candidatus Acidoferrales bacterium]
MKLARAATVLAGVAAILLAPLAGSKPARKEPSELRKDVDGIVKEAVTSHKIPSLVVQVTQNGKNVFQKAYGRDPFYPFAENTTSSTYALGPMSQVLTGAGILYLEEQGKLGLEDPVSKYLPGVPETWQAITLKQFLTHRSGIPALPKDARTFAAALEAVGKLPLRFRPGSQQGENSADYDVLGQVIEKVTGQPYLTFMDKIVFKQMKFAVTGDLSKLMFRFVKPQDFTFETTHSTQGDMTANGTANATSLTRGNDPTVKGNMLDLLYRGIPDYSIPSKGLASNLQDIARISSATFDSGGFQPFSDPNYLILAPGWKSCSTGKDTMLTASGMVSAGFGINVTVLPNRKVALVLLWKMEKGSDVTMLHDESQEILETALSIPVSTWVCTGEDEEEPDEDQQQQ